MIDLFPFLQRLSARERFLALATGGVVVLVANLFVLSALINGHRQLAATVAEKKRDWEFAREELKEAPAARKQAEWINAHQPALTNPQRAGIELLSQVDSLAAKTGVTLEHKEVNPQEPANSAASAYRQSLSVSVVTKSGWAELVHFLAALQPKPDAFIVIENVTLHSDAVDTAGMRGELRIAKWYAPVGGK